MELISFNNIIRGFNTGTSMCCVCPNQEIADHLFKRAKDLWYIEGFSEISNLGRTLRYGPVADRLVVRFRPVSALGYGSYKGFRGMYLFHPGFDLMDMADNDFHLHSELSLHNERYREQWRA